MIHYMYMKFKCLAISVKYIRIFKCIFINYIQNRSLIMSNNIHMLTMIHRHHKHSGIRADSI